MNGLRAHPYRISSSYSSSARFRTSSHLSGPVLGAAGEREVMEKTLKAKYILYPR